jgi:hypothetical protein
MREEGSDSGHEQLGFLNKERGILVLIVATETLHSLPKGRLGQSMNE